MSDKGTPEYRGFEYRVRLAVSIPSVWAELLREVALHHYDHWCRQSATSGVVNGLYNTSSAGDFRDSSFPVAWRDLDLLAKIMEQSCYYATSEEAQVYVTEINRWIHQAKDWIIARSEALAKWDAAQVAPMSLRPTKE